MKIAGIVAEYNPFHNGHAHHIDRTRAVDNSCEAIRCGAIHCSATHIVAVMSGNFVQRGEPAALPKADRVRAALSGGVDLVLELPLPWAMASAEAFAFGAVSLLDALGCVDVISFGSECGDLELLNKAVYAMESERFSNLLRYHLEGGISFPDARQRAVAEIAGNKVAALLESANNTLGMEYIKALHKLQSPVQPFTVPRFGAGHDDGLPVGDIASASFLRTLLDAGRIDTALPYMPVAVRGIVHEAMQAGRCPAQTALIERAILTSLRRYSKEQLALLPGISEGLENRFYDAIRLSGSLAELYTKVKTRRYPLTRLQRTVMAGFLGLKTGWEKRQPPYIRVLGANTRGMEILRAAKGTRLPIVSRASQWETLPEEAKQLFSLESRAADLYALSLPNPLPCGTEFTNGFIRMEY